MKKMELRLGVNTPGDGRGDEGQPGQDRDDSHARHGKRAGQLQDALPGLQTFALDGDGHQVLR